MARAYQHKNTAVFLLNYHFVFCPKRRRKVLLGKLRDRLETLLREKTKALDWEIIALEIMLDHVHLFIGVDPEVAPNQIMHALKGYTSRILRQEFPDLLTLPSLWTRRYFVSTAGNVSSTTIEKYIATQKTRD
ncbi:MAG: IS200/IS605 family transposase [Trueperaceae bacterium]